MEEFKVNRLYKGNISLRSYDVDKWIAANSSVRVIVDNEKGYMDLTPELLANPDKVSKTIESSFEGQPSYHLRDYKWNPIITNDREAILTSLIGDEWFKKIGDLFDRPNMKRINTYLAKRRKEVNVFPSSKNTFRAFKLTPYSKIKVVILGQDPYTKGEADGLAFSSQGMKTPFSLQMIFKEIQNTEPDFNTKRLANLVDWAEQGVFLFNTILTVDENAPMSHTGKGWEQFSAEVISRLNKHSDPLVFVLWGTRAKEYEKLLDKNFHLVLKSNHPAAEGPDRAGGFLGNGHFAKINEHLMKYFNYKIKW